MQEFIDAFTIATQTTWDSKELEVYEYISLKEFDEINALRTAERKGMERGIKKGIEQEKINIAKNSIAKGLDDETIAAITNLDLQIIRGLR